MRLGVLGRHRVGHVAAQERDLGAVPGPEHEVEEVVGGLQILFAALGIVDHVGRHRPEEIAFLGRRVDDVVALVPGDEHHGLPAVDDVDLLAGDQVHRLLEARPDDPELAGLLVLDQEVDHGLDLLGRHVGRIIDLGLPGVLEEQRGLLAGGRIVVLERDEALELGIEQRGVGVELAGLLRQIGEGIALQHGRHAVDPVLVADELEAGRARREILLDVGVALPVGQPARVQLEDQIVVDQRLLHAADDVDHVEGGLAAARDQLVDDGRGRVADRDQIDLVAGRLLEPGPVASGIADADIGDGERPAGRESRRRQPAPADEPGDAENGARLQHLPPRRRWHSSVLVHDGLPRVRASWPRFG